MVADRQRALSYWSFGSWGGGGITSFAGGLIATYFGMALYFRIFYRTSLCYLCF